MYNYFYKESSDSAPRSSLSPLREDGGKPYKTSVPPAVPSFLLLLPVEGATEQSLAVEGGGVCSSPHMEERQVEGSSMAWAW
jgi:hypothetical protein